MKKKIVAVISMILCGVMFISSCTGNFSSSNNATNPDQSADKPGISQSATNPGTTSKPSGEKLPTAWDGSIATSFAGGSGTESNPYKISNGNQLAYLATLVNKNDSVNSNSVYFKLTDDINLANQEWNPIGTGLNISGQNDDEYTFKANFDGGNHIIYNVSITTPYRTYYDYFGLFGKVTGDIRNVTLQNVNIKMNEPYVGGLCGYSSGTISGCNVQGGKIEGTICVGGMIGYTEKDANITNCSANLSANGHCKVGGLIGSVDSTVVKYSNSSGTVSKSGEQGNYKDFGGLIGCTRDSEISYCYSTADVVVSFNDSISNEGVGGFIGRADSNDESKISVCYSTGQVTISGYTGGSWQAKVGGFIGLTSPFAKTIIENCYTTSDIQCLSTTDPYDGFAQFNHIGGFIGLADTSSITINKCYAAGNITYKPHAGKVGGFIGRLYEASENTSISDCVAYGNITAYASNMRAPETGGFIGNSYSRNPGADKLSNFYRAEYQRVTTSNTSSYNNRGEAVLADDLNTASFYKNTLNWGDEWDFSDLDVENGKFPTLVE